MRILPIDVKAAGTSFLVAVLAGLLTACSGRNFTRPADGEFVPGTTTKSGILARMGKPNFTHQATANGEPIAILSYAYGQDINARVITFLLHDDVLVGSEFTSSFREDRTHFDPDRARSVRPGMSRAEVETLLGKAPGEYRYPLTSTQTSRSIVYKFSQAAGNFHRQMLVVEIDDQNSVQKIEFDELEVPAMKERPNRMELLWSDDHRRWIARAPAFSAGWAQLRKGMLPAEAEALLGKGSCIVGMRAEASSQVFDRMVFSAVDVPNGELSRDCFLEFDQSGLAAWSMFPPLSW